MDTLPGLAAGAPASALLLDTMLVVGVLGLYWRPALVERNLLRPHGLARRGDWFTLVTSGFVHADLAHLLFNAFTFWAFGFDLERYLGSARFAVLYALGLIAGSVATWIVHRRQPGYASLGASGAILAVLFASIVAFPRSSIFVLPLPVPIPAPLFALGYLAFSIVASGTRHGRVNHDAHVAGALTGLVFMAVVAPGSFAQALNALMSQLAR